MPIFSHKYVPCLKKGIASIKAMPFLFKFWRQYPSDHEKDEGLSGNETLYAPA